MPVTMSSRKFSGTSKDEREAAHKAAELEKRRVAEQARLDAHNRRVTIGNTPGRVMSKPRTAPSPPFDPEAGRYRMARRLPGARVSPGMPTGAPFICPHCGTSMPSYLGRGRYICGVRRLIPTNRGCGRTFYGACHASETPYSPEERDAIENDDSLPVFVR